MKLKKNMTKLQKSLESAKKNLICFRMISIRWKAKKKSWNLQ